MGEHSRERGLRPEMLVEDVVVKTSGLAKVKQSSEVMIPSRFAAG